MSEVASTNAAPNGETPPVSPCPLNDLPENLHQYIHGLESRIRQLETDRDRFSDSLLKMGKFIFDSPMSKIMLAAFPKDVQQKLREQFGGNSK